MLDALCRLLPGADIFTLFCDPDALSAEVRKHTIKTSFLNPLRRGYRSLLPLMPMALESLDLRGYDLVVSQRIRAREGRTHLHFGARICATATRRCAICGTCIRPIGGVDRVAMEARGHGADHELSSPLGLCFRGACRSISSPTVRTCARASGRPTAVSAEVIHPPVDVDSFYWKPPEDYFLMVSELVPYKRVDSAVRCFSRNGRRLVIAGSGPEYQNLRKMAAPNVSFSAASATRIFANCMPAAAPF